MRSVKMSDTSGVQNKQKYKFYPWN